MKQFTCSNSKMPIWVDFVPSCWDMTKVKFIAKVVPGATPKSTIASFWNGDIPFVTPADYVTEDHYVGHWARTITEEGMNSCSASLLPPNSVIVSNRAPIGLVAINKVPVCTNQGCKGLVVKSREYSPEYLYRLLSVADDALNALGNGTTYQELSGKALSDFVIQKPPLDVQRSIVAFLDSRCKPIDEAITRHRLIIDKLEDYRKAVIKNAVTFGLNDEPLKNTGIPWIESVPKTWNVMRVKDIAKLHNGSDPKTEGSVPVYGSGKGSFKSCGEYKEGPTVLLGRKGTLHIPHYIEGKYWNVDTAFDVSMIGNNNLRYFYYLATCFNYDYYRTNTARPSMTQSDYENMKIAVPSYKEQVDIASYLDYKCAAIDEGVARQEQVIAKLEEYRKSLIFHAVTGRIDCTGGAR